MKSYIVVTRNNEKTIGEALKNILPIENDDELIIFDDLSKDNTVPIIIETIGINFVNTEKYRFYINSKRQQKRTVLKKALSIAKGEPVIVEVEVKNDKNK